MGKRTAAARERHCHSDHERNRSWANLVANLRAHLTHAPIREAMIDITIAPRVDFQAILAAAKNVGPPFERRSDIWEATIGFQFDQDGAGRAQKGGSSKVGVRFDSINPPHVLQFRTGGFTFSRLTPYEDWNQVREAAKPCWEMYSDAVGPCHVTRLAVRYINALRLPLPSQDFSEFLAAAPSVPKELPQTVTGFLQRVVIAAESHTAVVTQSLESVQLDQQQFAVVLDIDVFANIEITPSDPAVWDTLDKLRDAKNEIFFRHLTEKAVDVFA